MIEVYSADIRCSNKSEPMYMHDCSINDNMTIGESLLHLKKLSEDQKTFVQLVIEDSDEYGTRYIAKYKFNDELICPKDYLERMVESIWRVLDDGGETIIVKLAKEE